MWCGPRARVVRRAVRRPPAGDDGDAFIHATGEALEQRFGINHATLQLERGDDACAGQAHAGHEHGH